MTSIPLWLTDEQACGYLPGRMARSAAIFPGIALDTSLYAALLPQGFRRSGDQVYRPHCQTCHACTPTRVLVHHFKPDRRQKRCWQRNLRTQIIIKPARFDAEHFELYRRYQLARHDEAQNRVIGRDDYVEFLTSTWCDTWFVEFRIDDQLMAVAVVDVLDTALSAVYTFFDPLCDKPSPGVFAILWQIEKARTLGLPHVYLGYWIEDCRKMAYKIQYQPLEGLIDSQWQPLPCHILNR
ncbi:MAG: arginyltransferase [Methylomonas sp.]|nr:arginyltransferase [Methylomonas sp.]MBS3964520.1 arginyltransferase [Methylomonas sp.]PPD21962.1 MAG: arginyltransferase [Methylomonas sp.]PPD25014.1 MAG: arginyltransferase [Methylomonas sp.]PPD34354.1 MAG: arginyltransferase [Methylomonas sp.]